MNNDNDDSNNLVITLTTTTNHKIHNYNVGPPNVIFVGL